MVFLLCRKHAHPLKGGRPREVFASILKIQMSDSGEERGEDRRKADLFTTLVRAARTLRPPVEKRVPRLLFHAPYKAEIDLSRKR